MLHTAEEDWNKARTAIASIEMEHNPAISPLAGARDELARAHLEVAALLNSADDFWSAFHPLAPLLPSPSVPSVNGVTDAEVEIAGAPPVELDTHARLHVSDMRDMRDMSVMIDIHKMVLIAQEDLDRLTKASGGAAEALMSELHAQDSQVREREAALQLARSTLESSSNELAQVSLSLLFSYVPFFPHFCLLCLCSPCPGLS